MEWISIKDRLPEDFKDVFIYCGNLQPPITRTGYYQSNHKSWYKHAFGIPDELITHWAKIEPPAKRKN